MAYKITRQVVEDGIHNVRHSFSAFALLLVVRKLTHSADTVTVLSTDFMNPSVSMFL
mgnify:CR=1 FL=1